MSPRGHAARVHALSVHGLLGNGGWGGINTFTVLLEYRLCSSCIFRKTSYYIHDTSNGDSRWIFIFILFFNATLYRYRYVRDKYTNVCIPPAFSGKLPITSMTRLMRIHVRHHIHYYFLMQHFCFCPGRGVALNERKSGKRKAFI